jgi:predicted nucleic acid-binding protein
MKVLVDTSVWSEALRRNRPLRGNHAHELAQLIEDGDAAMIGPIRQELLSNWSFPDEPLDTEDFENGAKCFNTCRARGIQGAHTDFLICAFAMRHGMPILSVDKDFKSYAWVLPITLHVIRPH